MVCRVGSDIGATGTVGAIQPCNDAILVDAAEMGVSRPLLRCGFFRTIADPLSTQATICQTLGESESGGISTRLAR